MYGHRQIRPYQVFSSSSSEQEQGKPPPPPHRTASSSEVCGLGRVRSEVPMCSSWVCNYEQNDTKLEAFQLEAKLHFFSIQHIEDSETRPLHGASFGLISGGLLISQSIDDFLLGDPNIILMHLLFVFSC